MSKGIVIRSTGSWVDVLVGTTVIPSRIRGKMRLIHENETQPVTIGDQVSIQIQEDETGLITDVAERQNCLYRRAAGRKVGKRQILVSNVDHIWIVQAILQPKLNIGLIDRLLVACEAQEISAGLLINKTDLVSWHDLPSVEKLADSYQDLGYPVILTSAKQSHNLDVLRQQLSGKTSVFLGPSGVGKSSLLNAIDPQINVPVEEISQKTRKGRHTTAHATLYPLSDGGSVADTPGIREFGLLDIEPWELAHYFPEFRSHIGNCRYSGCTHDHEPDCGVKDARKLNIISLARYDSYLNILYSLRLGTSDTGR
ncbi:MAG: ribosome small subunit-dependent GTPase A [Bacteroidetes bacterium]|nr:ribosome small subunit-dependent GTPase A [Bacteroidota bacterium]